MKHCIILMSALLGSVALYADNCANYIRYQVGEVPIVLTSPHGASKQKLLLGVPPRQGVKVQRFVNRADQYTDEIAWLINDELKRYGLKPYMVVADIHRSQIDFNRAYKNAYESSKAKACYEKYHHKIKDSIAFVKKQWGDGFLLDIHGQSKYDVDILRGTRNGQTIRRLTVRYGKDVTEEENGFFFLLRQQGYAVWPKPLQKEKYYYGGFTLLSYGSHNDKGLDALQIEIGRQIRIDNNQRQQLAKDIAQAVRSFYLQYYFSPSPPSSVVTK
ncbi:MAG: hypothetical protein ACRBCI_01370 [Cellvibrionaceae bacterium]